MAPFTGSSFVPVPKHSVQTSVLSVWRSSVSSIKLTTLGTPLLRQVYLMITYNALPVTLTLLNFKV